MFKNADMNINNFPNNIRLFYLFIYWKQCLWAQDSTNDNMQNISHCSY